MLLQHGHKTFLIPHEAYVRLHFISTVKYRCTIVKLYMGLGGFPAAFSSFRILRAERKNLVSVEERVPPGHDDLVLEAVDVDARLTDTMRPTVGAPQPQGHAQ